MSSSTLTPPLPIITTAPMTTAGSPTPPAPITSAPPTTSIFMPEEMTSTLRDLVTAVQGISLYLVALHTALPAAPPAYSHPATHWPIQNTSGPSGTPLLPFQAGYTGGPPPPLYLPWYSVRFPPSPSPIPAWLTGTSPPPVYTEAGDPPVPTLQSGASSGSAGAYDGLPTVDRAPSSSLLRTAEPVGHGAPTQTPPRFAKIDFATYDGTEDPLNWLNQCEQFFRGQRTLASERTWLASYHLRGAAQTWYYALEQDEGSMPSWERFRELCLLRFGPPVRGSRLAELGRLPFTSTVQNFTDRFQALACHASGVTAQQRADLFVSGLPDHIRVDVELFQALACHASGVTAQQRADLFVGGLPDHIRVDVELRGPQDLQSAMYYARAFERRAVAIQQESPSRTAGSLPGPDSAQGRPA
ncbi:uncharacterized protein [Aegilops tauschii subsp. strangulata]|uniref:uncharacterized protein n=1 Tax=Aegilops tauschii subsp. strangulata TaxID=200361 RepID=UPI003CC8E07F